MKTYQVKRGHALPDLERLMNEIFGSASRNGDDVSASFGGIEKISAKYNGKKLELEIVNKKIAGNEAKETLKRYSTFLDKATGYTSKERMKNARKV
jgi:hypothetical protein